MSRAAAVLSALTVTLALTLPALASESDGVVVKTGTGAALDHHLTRFSDYGYSFSVLVAHDGEVILRKAYGPELSTQSVFNVASVAKQFTAAAILKLADEGRLSLTDPITRFFPEGPAPFRTITLDHLLAHTSGIKDDYGLYSVEPDLDQHAFRRRILTRPLAHAPGERWTYSNDGYSLLAMVIEKTSGQAFDAYFKEALFRPAGLQHTGFMGDVWPDEQRPVPYGGALPPEPRENRWVGGFGASSVVTSPSDLYRWDRALHGGAVLSPALVRKLGEAQVDVYPPILSYARGWWERAVEISGTPRRNVFHSGREEDGANAWYSRFPSDELVIIFASHQSWENVSLREALFSATSPSVLERVIYGGQITVPPQPVPASNLSRLECDYRLEDGSWLRVTARNENLIVEPHGQPAFDALLPQGGDQLTREVLARATDHTRTIFADLARGERGSFNAAVGERSDGSHLPPPLFTSYEVLGSYPINRISPKKKDVVTHVLMSDKRNTQHLRIVWGDHEIGAVFPGHPIIVPVFRQTSAHGFSNFHPFIQAPAHIAFGEGELRFAGDEAAVGRCQAKGVEHHHDTLADQPGPPPE